MRNTITRFPGAEDAPRADSLRPSGRTSAADTSGIGRGLQALGQGVSQLGAGISAYAEQEKRKQAAADTAVAEAAYLRGTLDFGNELDQDSDYETHGQRADERTKEILESAAENIRDQDVRDGWKRQMELRRLPFVDGIADRARGIGDDVNRVRLEQSFQEQADYLADPNIGDAQRQEGRANLDAAMASARDEALLSPAQYEVMRKKYLDGSANRLALNQFELDRVSDAEGALRALDVREMLPEYKEALAQVGPDLEPDILTEIAGLIGEDGFPTDPDEIADYMANPETAKRFSAAAVQALSDRYNGDIGAVFIALDPEGGMDMADKWVKSGHGDDMLPDGLAKRVGDKTAAVLKKSPPPDIPIFAYGHVNINGVQKPVIEAWKSTQALFGRQVPITSGHRTKEHNDAVGGAKGSQHLDGNGIDVDWSGMSKAEKVRLIEIASSQGFTGIGVYKGHVHLDKGGRRVWDKTGSGEFSDVLDRHSKSTIEVASTAYRGVSQKYAAMTYEQRLAAAKQAQQTIDSQAADNRYAIGQATKDAPAALSTHGEYTGYDPTRSDFINSYGTEKGSDLHDAYTAAKDVATKQFGFLTQSMDEINETLAEMKPTGTGAGTALEQEAYANLNKAAANIFKARQDDPAGYTLEAFPEIKKLWDEVGDDPGNLSLAIAKTAAAQEKLGITEARLLPGYMATQAANVFNNTELDSQARINGVTGLVFRTNDNAQRAAIFDQLVDSGVPPMVEGAMRAFERGDEGAGQTLMRAALIDPDKLPGTIQAKDTEIKERIQAKMFDENQIGDVIYGVVDGSIDNLEAVQADTNLITNAVKLRMRDGESLENAINLTVKDMYGDVHTLIGKGWGGGTQAALKVTVPDGTDDTVARAGFVQMLPRVTEAIGLGNATIDMDQFEAATGMRAIVGMGLDIQAKRIVDEGYFVNAGEDDNGVPQYHFANPFISGTVIGDAEGKPLVFRLDEILTEGQNAPPVYGSYDEGYVGYYMDKWDDADKKRPPTAEEFGPLIPRG